MKTTVEWIDEFMFWVEQEDTPTVSIRQAYVQGFNDGREYDYVTPEEEKEPLIFLHDIYSNKG